MKRFFDDDDMNFATLIALGSTYRQCADAGEVLATIERIPDGDRVTEGVGDIAGICGYAISG